MVGGGVLGAWLAYTAARRGRRVTLLERAHVAAGATGRNGGFVVPTTAQAYPAAIATHGRARARGLRQLAVDGARLITGVVSDEGIACDHRPRGSVRLAQSDEAATARHGVELARADGFEESWLDRDDLAAAIGIPLDERIVGGALAAGALTDPVALIEGVLAAARRHGACVHPGIRVDAVRSAPSGAVLTTSAGTVGAAQVVIATNAWLDELVPRLAGVVTPVQGQVLATAPTPATFPLGMVASAPGGEAYIHQAPDGTVVVGGCRCVDDAPLDPRAQTPQPTVHRALRGVLPRLFPTLGPLPVRHAWAGAMAVTPDHLPVVDEVDTAVWAAGGFNGHGMPYAPVVADLLAERLEGAGRAPDLDPFALDRPAVAQPTPTARGVVSP